MSRSARKDKPRCPKCRKKGVITHPIPISIKDTGHNVYTKLECATCKYVWQAPGPSAERYARAHGITIKPV